MPLESLPAATREEISIAYELSSPGGCKILTKACADYESELGFRHKPKEHVARWCHPNELNDLTSFLYARTTTIVENWKVACVLPPSPMCTETISRWKPCWPTSARKASARSPTSATWRAGRSKRGEPWMR